MSRPFIKRFATKDKKYIYDVNTAHILEVDPVIFSAISR